VTGPALSAGGPGSTRRILLTLALTALLGISSASTAAAADPADTAEATPPASASARLLVTYRAGTTASGRARAIEGADVSADRRIPALGVDIVAVAPADLSAAIADLRADPNVARVEVDGRVAATWVPATDPEAARQWSLLKTDVNRAWDMTSGSPTVVIAVIDTGVRPDEPDLAGRLTAGYDFVDDDTLPTDEAGHGTTVAATMVANRSDGIGVAGVCPGCRVMPVRVLGADGYGAISDVALGIVYAVDHGAEIINLSLGSSGGSQVEADAIAYALAHDVLVVAAAGNEGTTARFYPAAYAGVVSVGAVDYVDRRISWSTYGAWVAMVAPGCVQGRTSIDAGGVAHFGSTCGTSFAAPQVAGVAGLLKSLVPSATAASMRAALTGTTALGVSNPDGAETPVAANGRLDASAALRAIAGGPLTTSLATDPAGFPVLIPGESVTTIIAVDEIYAASGIRTTTLRTVDLHITSGSAAEFEVVVRDGAGARRVIGRSAAGTFDRSAADLFADAYTIEIRPVGASRVTVTATASIAPATAVEPLAVTLDVVDMTDTTVTVDATVAGGLPGYRLSTWVTAWQMFEPVLDAAGVTRFSFARSCVTEMRISVRVADQAGHGTTVDSDPLIVPRASGCPAPGFSVSGAARFVELVEPASLTIDLSGAVDQPGAYYFQWHGAGTDRAIEAYLPDPELSWFGPGVALTVPCAMLAAGHQLVLIAYSQANTNLAAIGPAVTLPGCTTPSPTPTPNPTPAPSPEPTPAPVTPLVPDVVEPAPDLISPTIIGRGPGRRATGVDRDRNVRIRFSEPVLGISATTVRLVDVRTGRTVRIRTRRYDPATRTVTLDPYYRMRAWTTYRVVIRAGIRDLAGNTLPAQSWTFRTGPS
jgi:subtilisin family serine protease